MIDRYENFRVAYPAILDQILTTGEEVAPRGLETLELLGHSFMVEDATDMLAVKTGRKLNVPFAAGDALSVIGGFSDHEWLSRWNPRIAQYGEHGAYGPRLVSQVVPAINRLQWDRDSRRAVMTVWDPALDSNYGEGFTDYPCTVSCQLMVRRDRLDMHVSMRANDAWFGLPYDVFTFSQLQCTVASLMQVEPGSYYHHATSLHLYEKDWEGAMEVRATPYVGELTSFRPTGIDAIGEGPMRWNFVIATARNIRLGRSVPDTPSTNWYKEKLS